MTKEPENLPLDARASDPAKLGWMVGSPPPPERLIRFADGSWFRFPQHRWSFSHMRQFVPTSVVSRGRGPVRELPRAERKDLDGVSFLPIGGTAPMTWAESLDANYTDGILVLHRGDIVYERYFGVLKPEQPHIAFSVTKSFVATLALMLIADGQLDETARVDHYLPELAKSGLGDATLRQVLDMTTGLTYLEEYDNSRSDTWDLTMAGGFLARPQDYRGPESYLEYLATLTKARAHGEQFAYKTVNTDALGAILRRVSSRTLSELLSERVFARLGAEVDAYFPIDSTGAEFAGGGLCLTLRDLARFGEMMRLDGCVDGESVVPKSALEDIRRGGSRALFAASTYTTLPGWSYRDMWWISHNAHGAYMGRGIHGQAVYIDPAAQMVIARFASHPRAGNINLDPTSIPAYAAMAERLIT